jgi:hypothetical protein
MMGKKASKMADFKTSVVDATLEPIWACLIVRLLLLQGVLVGSVSLFQISIISLCISERNISPLPESVLLESDQNLATYTFPNF